MIKTFWLKKVSLISTTFFPVLQLERTCFHGTLLSRSKHLRMAPSKSIFST